MLGASDGVEVPVREGDSLGVREGPKEGPLEGTSEGTEVGTTDGACDGAAVVDSSISR